MWTGIVKCLSRAKWYGFIRPHGSASEHVVHFDALARGSRLNQGILTLLGSDLTSALGSPSAQGAPTMKFTFRVTVMTILLSLIVLTVAALGIRFYANARFTADNLTRQILEQTA